MAVAGSTLMVVATNESSFGNSPASDQLIGLVRVNAAAVGQELVHAAITGRSAFIDAAGEVGQRTDLFEERVLYGRVQMRTAGPTVYTRFGDWVLLIALVGVAVALGIRGEVGFEVVGRRRSDR
jgi:apolipoprotein N-acyltransferase